MTRNTIKDENSRFDVDIRGDEHGRMYWFVVNVLKALWDFLRNHKKFFLCLIIVIVTILVLFRPVYHPYVLSLRIRILEITAMIFSLILAWYLLRRRAWKRLGIFVLVISGFITGMIYSDFSPRRYLSMYYLYRDMPRRELAELPVTDHERIHPLNSIRVLSQESMSEVEQASDPDFVRDGQDYRWSMAIEPVYDIQRISGKISKVISISGSAPSPNFSEANRISVNFAVGENLLFSKNSRTAVIRTFGLVRFFLYEPVDVKYVRDDTGELVELITLARWKGFLFVRPEFGGVCIIRQNTTGLLSGIKRFLVGEGEWIPPRSINSHPFLQGQNIVPEKVSRFAAESFRFQAGFLAPMPGYHKGDVRIPDLVGDVNSQPFTTFFRFDGHPGYERNKLYHYYALEPYNPEKQGLNTSVFYPADGLGPVYFYQHYLKGEGLTGVSAVAPKVMESRKQYDWAVNYPAEHRPFIREIDGRIRFFWLTTVVTKKDSSSRDFVAGSTPEVVLTDALYKTPVWVDSRKLETWVDTLKLELNTVWKE